MKKKLKIVLSVALCMIMLVGTVAAGTGGLADVIGTIKADAASNVTYTYSGGVLTLSGSGRMDAYTSSADVPWYANKNDITSVVIGPNISYISDYAFTDYKGDGYQNITNYKVDAANLNYASVSASDPTLTSSTSCALYASSDTFAYAELIKAPTAGITKFQIASATTAIRKGAFYNCDNYSEIIIVPNISGTAEITASDGSKTTVTVKGSASNYSRLTSIDSYAFYGCSKIEELILPLKLTSLGDYVFANCSKLSNLKTIEVTTDDTATGSGDQPKINGTGDGFEQEVTNYSLTTTSSQLGYLGSHAFENCTSLIKLTIYGTSSLNSIKEYTFSGCTYLFSLNIKPDLSAPNITSIGNNAFCGCAQLSNIEGKQDGIIRIPEGVTTIGEKAFEGNEIVTDVVISSTVTSIGDAAFADFKRLTAFTVNGGSSYSSDANGVLYNKDLSELIQYPCGRIATGFDIPDTVTKIDECSFSNCTYLQTVTVPKALTEIGKSAFYGCANLKDFIISEDCALTAIPKNAFENCSSLTNLVIPSTVTSIDATAFTNCTGLADIYYIGTETQWNTIGGAAALPLNTEGNTFTVVHFISSSTPTATFKLNGGYIGDIKDDLVFYLCKCQNTHKYVPSADPLKSKYSFAGWMGLGKIYKTAAEVEQILNNTTFTTDLVFTAVWTSTDHAGHEVTLRDQKEATCSEDGYSGDTYCETCQVILEKGYSIPSTGHNYVLKFDETKHWNECTVCHDIQGSENHKFVSIAVTPHTATEKGTHRLVCSVCGYTDGKVYDDATIEHVWVEKKIEATCTEPGSVTKTCSVCGATETTEIPALGHKDANDDGVCDVCDLIIDRDKYDAYQAKKDAASISLNIAQPSTQNISYGQTLYLHATTNTGSIPTGYSLVWNIEEGSDVVSITPSDDGWDCAVKVSGTGTPVISVTLVDSNGTAVTQYNTTNVAIRDSVRLITTKNIFRIILFLIKSVLQFGLNIDK